ncbi:MAG: amidohydrolase family protein [Actinomycetota bacterium]
MTVIDAHSHLYLPSYLDLLAERREIPRVVRGEDGDRLVTFPEEQHSSGPGGRPITPAFWDVDVKLRFMDEQGIDRAIVTLGNPWLDPFDGPEAASTARSLNAELAALHDRTAGRILCAGVLPSDSVESAVAVLAEIGETPTLFGVGGGPVVCGHHADEPELDPLWDALEATGVPYLLHPKGETAIEDLRGYGAPLPVAIGFPMETTIALSRLALGGVLERHPGLRIVAAHGGGAIPYLVGRLDMVWGGNDGLRERLASPPSEGLKRLYLDAVLYTAGAARAAADLVGPDRLLFGTDHPWHSVGEPLERAFDERALERIRRGTAVELFGLQGVGPGVAPEGERRG